MSMALALEYTQVWLREKNNWLPNQCGVQYEAIPAMDAGPFYVAVDDAGVETGNPDTDSLKETLTLTIGIWRRAEHLGRDKRGNLKLPHDHYLLGAYTLHDMERAVVVHKTTPYTGEATKNGLHKNYAFLVALNAYYNLPSAAGAKFTMPLAYMGRGRMEAIAVDDGAGSGATAWYGYRLRFRGLTREQKLREAAEAAG